MDKYFYDKKNFDNINKVIGTTINQKTGAVVDPKHAKLVYKLMDYVYKNTDRPANLRKKQFLSLLNHQVLKLAIPRIEKLTVGGSGDGGVAGGVAGGVGGGVSGGVGGAGGVSASMMDSGGGVGGMGDDMGAPVGIVGRGVPSGLDNPQMNAELKREFNLDGRLEQLQANRTELDGVVDYREKLRENALAQQGSSGSEQERDVSDNAMSAEESAAAYERLLADRNSGLETRNENMMNFEDQQNRINNEVETFSGVVEQRMADENVKGRNSRQIDDVTGGNEGAGGHGGVGGGERAVMSGAGALAEQFEPILGGGHPAASQASDLNNLLMQDVSTLMEKRMDSQARVPDNGGLNGDSGVETFRNSLGSAMRGRENMDGGVGGGEDVSLREDMVDDGVVRGVVSNADKVAAVQERVVESETNNALRNQLVIPPMPREKYITRDYFINIDSRDRDLEVYPDVNKFQVKFSPSSDSNEMFTYYDRDGTVLYTTRKNFVGDAHGASLPDIFENIYSIECVGATVPYDITYVCGICPYKYNSFRLDENKVENANQFPSWAYGPVYSAPAGNLAGQNIGVATSVLDEPYLLLNIDELDGHNPYIGTNKATTNTFAKLLHDGYFGVLTSFIQLKTGNGEKKLYKPQALGSVDKMTLNLLKHNGVHYNFGTDKIFVKKFEAVAGNVCQTKVTIIAPQDKCTDCKTSHGHCLRPGNLIYFYDTLDCVNNEVLFYKDVKPVVSDVEPLGEGAGIDTDVEVDASGSSIEISGTVDNKDGVTRGVNFGAFLGVGDYIMLNNGSGTKFAIRVESLRVDGDGGTVLVCNKPDGFGNTAQDITEFGFYRKNMKGIKSENEGDFNYLDGKRVCGTGDDEASETPANLVFFIDYPFANLPERLRGNDLEFPNGQSEVFFIKKKLQVSYTFKITTLEQDIGLVPSRMI